MAGSSLPLVKGKGEALHGGYPCEGRHGGMSGPKQCHIGILGRLIGAWNKAEADPVIVASGYFRLHGTLSVSYTHLTLPTKA